MKFEDDKRPSYNDLFEDQDEFEDEGDFEDQDIFEDDVFHDNDESVEEENDFEDPGCDWTCYGQCNGDSHCQEECTGCSKK